MKMEWHESSSCERLFRFDRRMRSIRYHLRAIEQDITLAEAGWTINYAIDFCELYRYAFPLHQLLSSGENHLYSRQHRRDLVDKTASMCVLLEGINLGERLVLLPPYAAELSDFLENMIPKQHVIEDKINSIKESGSLLSKEDQSKINYFLKYDQNNETIPEDLRKEVLGILLKDCKELLFTWLSVFKPGVTLINKHLSGKKPKIHQFSSLIDSFHSWEKTKTTIEKMMLDDIIKGDWFNLFQNTRNRYTSDLADATAVETIIKLQSQLVKEKEVVVLLSDAPTMTRVLNWDLIDFEQPQLQKKPRGIIRGVSVDDDPTFGEYRLLRTPRTFLFYLICSGDNREETLNETRKRLKQVNAYFSIAARIVQSAKMIALEDTDEAIRQEMIGSCDFLDPSTGCISDVDEEECKKCPLYNIREKLSENLTRHEKIVRLFENASLYTNMEKFIGSVIQPKRDLLKKAYGEELSQAVQKFMDLSQAKNIPLAKEMGDEQRMLTREVLSIRENITSSMIKDITGHSLEELKYKLHRHLRIFGRIGFKDE